MQHYGNMMEAMNNFFNAVQAEQAALIAESNAQAEEARALIARVQNTIEKHDELNAVMDMIAVRVNEGCSTIKTTTNNIKDALSDIINGEVPECSVDLFEGYCEQCGEEVTSGCECKGKDGELLCPMCFEAEAKNEEEPADAEAEAIEA